MEKNDPEYLIAIGASAGGMEEINTFFDHTPLDSVSYVIIQHLSPDFKSRMVELLARHSRLLVKEAEQGMAVQSNSVYLIPNDQYLTLSKGHLHLVPKDGTKGPHLTVNTFFSSMALDLGQKAIGVILSGLGTDGTEGVRAIKKAGGMVIARDPHSSEFASMPSSAIATGLVDFVLEPEQMPGAIQDYITYGDKALADLKADEQYIRPIVELIADQLPLDFSEYKQTTILRRIKRRATYSNFKTLKGYLEFLSTAPDEVEQLAQDFLISVTAFFRDKEAFDCLEQVVLPGILKNQDPGTELKVWVAGCATGEEAYSIAMLICEQLVRSSLQDVVVKIFATDIDAQALAIAGKGVYPASLTRNIPADRLEKYFTAEGEYYRVKPALRKMIIFAHHDLVKNPPYCNMDLVSCRNLLIYMTPALQKKMYAMLLFGLKVGGYLFLGSSENPLPIMQNLEVTDSRWKVYRNLMRSRAVRFDAFALSAGAQEPKQLPPGDTLRQQARLVGQTEQLAEAVSSALARETSRLAICVDSRNQVISSYGDTGPFLLQKMFNNNFGELLPRPLAIAYHTARKQALLTNEKAVLSGISMEMGNVHILVNLSVMPLQTVKKNEPVVLVTFSLDEENAPESAEATAKNDYSYDERMHLDQYILNLEEEALELKAEVRAAYEKLDASNENLHSFNEELLSANEEMQSTNEEMQSVNEELHTINTEYHLKNKELQELNDDLNNYFRSNVNGQLFVDGELLLRKFSPGTVKLIHLLETDIGRPLSNIATNIRFETIAGDIKTVLSSGSVLSKEIETNDGKWYQLMTMPYLRQEDSSITGAILTFSDITELKQAQRNLDKKNQSLGRINQDLEHFIHAASHDLLAPLASIQSSIEVMNHMVRTNAKSRDFLAIINSSVKKFSALIREIAVIAKVESENAVPEMVDVNELITGVEWSLETKIRESGAVIKRNIEQPFLPFSKKNLRSIVFNLVANGIKFRKEDQPPEIYIACWREEDELILCVQDNGIGIPAKGIEKIFDLYGRLHQNVEGSGIGLYLAKKIVHAAGGDLVVESEVGRGSKFIIHLNA